MKPSAYRLVSRASASLALTGSLLLGGCSQFQAMVKIRQPEQIGKMPAAVRANVVTQNRLSDATLSILALSGQTPEGCRTQWDTCLSKLQGIPQLPNETVLATASELTLYAGKNAGCPPILPEQKNSGASLGRALLGQSRSKEAAPEAQARPLTACQLDAVQRLNQSLRFAHAYLFESERKPSERLFEERQVQVRDFYDDALSRLVGYVQQQGGDLALDRQVQLGPLSTTVRYRSPILAEVPPPAQLVAARDLSFEGLKTINRRDGFGTELVGIAAPRPPQPSPQAAAPRTEGDRPSADTPMQGGQSRWQPTAAGLTSRIHDLSYMPLTLVARFPDQTQDLNALLQGQALFLDLYSPFQTETIPNPALLKHRDALPQLPLAANYSAAYGLWLARTDLAQQAFESLLKQEARLEAPQLFMLEPYRPDKRVIVLVHGLAGSPETWISLTNDILGDPVLREHYQVWQVFYSTNMPILESRYQIQTLLEQAWRNVDPTGRAPASQDAVLIGHSMGGIISRLMVSNTDLTTPAFATLSRAQRERLRAVPLVSARLKLKPLPQIGRAIFVSAPFRGTDYASRWYGRVFQRLLKLPSGFLNSFQNVASRSLGQARWVEDRLFAEGGPLHLQTGIQDLDENSRFNRITQDVQIRPGLPYHLIMGNVSGITSRKDQILNVVAPQRIAAKLDAQNQPENRSMTADYSNTTDGVVPYRSAHLEGAASEQVLAGGHSIQETPAAILELRRILRLHWQTLAPDSKSRSAQ